MGYSWGRFAGDLFGGPMYEAGRGVKDAWNSFEVSGPNGVGGPVDDSRVHPNADGTYTAAGLVPNGDGTFYDPQTGTTYTDQSGQTPVAAQNVSQQTAGASQNSRAMLARLATEDTRSAEAFGGQQRLAGQLENTIRNPNAPSVARAQLDATIGNIDRQQLSGISGVGAPNAAAARRQALNNMASLDLGAAGQGAILRANEVAGAQNQLGNIYQNMAGNATNGAGQDMASGIGFSNQAMGGAQSIQTAQTAAQAANQAMAAGLLTGGLVTGSKFIPNSNGNGGTEGGDSSAGKLGTVAAVA